MANPYQLTNRPGRVQPHDIDRFFLALHGIAFTVTTAGTFHAVAAEVAAASLVAGENGQPVPDASFTLNSQGWLRDQVNGTFPLNFAAGDGGVPTFNDAEIVVYMQGGTGTWALRSMAFIAGALTNATLEPGDYVAQVPYNHSFETLPYDALIGSSKFRITQDPVIIPPLAQPEIETPVITTLNTIPDLSVAPRAGTFVKMYKNGLVYYSNEPAPIFSVVGVTVSYNAANAGVDLFPGDRVVFELVT